MESGVACIKLPLSWALVLVTVLVLAVDLPALAQRSISDNPSFRNRHRVRFGASRINCQNVTEIVFVGIFPCLRDVSNFVAPQNISQCDLLAEAAAYLAVERVNQAEDVLPNIALSLRPTYVSIDEVKHIKHNLNEVLKVIIIVVYMLGACTSSVECND